MDVGQKKKRGKKKVIKKKKKMEDEAITRNRVQYLRRSTIGVM